jgi:para-aminobenzoate synthetase component 1
MSEMTVSMESEGFAYGYGVFESIRVDHGVAIRMDAHLARFRRAWDHCFDCEFPDVTWKDVIDLVVSRNHLDGTVAAVKILAASGRPGEGERGISLAVTARPYKHRLEGSSRKGLRLAVYPHGRQSPLADHKTMNYMLQRMAGKWAMGHQADEAVLLNADGSVSETNTANLLVRFALGDLLATWGTPVESRKITVEDLKGAEGVLVTNALMGAVPAVEIDGISLPGDDEICAKINEALLDPGR